MLPTKMSNGCGENRSSPFRQSKSFETKERLIKTPLISVQPRRRFFTLLELLIALALIAIASTAVSYQMREAIQKKKFFAGLERLKTRICVIHKFALATETDWRGLLKKEKDGWIFSIECDEHDSQKFSLLHLDQMDISINGKKVKDTLVFDFFATGKAYPNGVFAFAQGSFQQKWESLDLFQRNEQSQIGPAPHSE